MSSSENKSNKLGPFGALRHWREIFQKKNRWILLVGFGVGFGVFYFLSLRPYLSNRNEAKIEAESLALFNKRYPDLAKQRKLRKVEESNKTEQKTSESNSSQ